MSKQLLLRRFISNHLSTCTLSIIWIELGFFFLSVWRTTVFRQHRDYLVTMEAISNTVQKVDWQKIKREISMSSDRKGDNSMRCQITGDCFAQYRALPSAVSPITFLYWRHLRFSDMTEKPWNVKQHENTAKTDRCCLWIICFPLYNLISKY